MMKTNQKNNFRKERARKGGLARWSGLTSDERSAEMSRVAKERWADKHKYGWKYCKEKKAEAVRASVVKAIKLGVVILALVALSGVEMVSYSYAEAKAPEIAKSEATVEVIEVVELSVIDKIMAYADDPETAIRIATCESQLGKYRDNWEGSGATGLFQFKPRTWNAYCEGSIDDDIAQIQCFNSLYPRHPSWWECE